MTWIYFLLTFLHKIKTEDLLGHPGIRKLLCCHSPQQRKITQGGGEENTFIYKTTNTKKDNGDHHARPKKCQGASAELWMHL